jgi:hypothetical protein
MKRKLTTTAALFCGALIYLTVSLGLNGKWAGTLKSPDGEEFPINYTLKVDGDKLTGTGTSPDGDIPISDGTVNGNDFSFKVIYNNVAIENNGTYYPAADSIGLNVHLNGELMHTTLKRAR